jgi:hypothetical protein
MKLTVAQNIIEQTNDDADRSLELLVDPDGVAKLILPRSLTIQQKIILQSLQKLLFQRPMAHVETSSGL